MNGDCILYHHGGRQNADLASVQATLRTAGVEAIVLDFWWEPVPGFHGAAIRGNPEQIDGALRELGWSMQWPRGSEA